MMNEPRERRTRPLVILGLAVVAAGGLGLAFRPSGEPPSRSVPVRMGEIDRQIGALGRVEGISEEIRLGARVPGRVRTILVAEGEAIRRGQLLLALENDDLQARVARELAGLRRAEARLDLLTNGARAEEREGAQAAVDEASAAFERARATQQRAAGLQQQGIISRDQLDQAESEERATAARLLSARLRQQVVLAGARAEQLAEARAEVALSRAQWEEARSLLEGSLVASPIDGIVVKRYVSVGETVSLQNIGAPLLSVADNSRVLVRAEVDESDIDRVQSGQSAVVTAAAFGAQAFPGRVLRLGGGLGRKDVKSDSATEKVDTEVLEVLIALDPGAETRLRVGLRVDVRISVAHTANVPVVPVEALYQETDGTYVRVRARSGWVSRRVVLGASDHSVAEVRSGLSVGDLVGF